MSTKGRDRELFFQWKEEKERTGNPINQYWEPLFNTVAVPAARHFTATYGGKTDVPESTIHTNAIQHAAKGIQTWNPDHASGANLFTHALNQIKNNSRRFIQQAQNAGHRVPEHRGYKARSDFEAARERFIAEHDYEPSNEELSKFLLENRSLYESATKHMTKKNALSYTESFLDDIKQNAPGIGSMIAEGVSRKISNEDMAVSEVKFKLNSGLPKDQQRLQVLEMMMAGKKGGEIAKALGISQSSVSILKNDVTKLLDEEQRRRK